MDDYFIVSISTWDSIFIHFNAFLFGIWLFFKSVCKWLWNPNAFYHLEIRDNPPECLVNTALGHHSYVKLKGIKLHYVECGSKNHPLLLLLHGFPDCWLSWRYQIPELSKYFHVVTLDLKGFGDSDKPPCRNRYRIDVLLIELKEFINALGASNCIIVGHDIGAILGWFLVHHFAEKVNKFVAVSCPHPNIFWNHLNNNSAFNSRWVNVVQLPYLPEIDALKEDVKLINEYYPHLQSQKNKKDPYVEAYKYTFSRTEDWTGPLNYFRNLPFSRITDNVELIPVPTLLITGNHDKIVKLEGIVKSTDYCEKFVMKIIEGAGHFPHQENPEMFNRILINFLIKDSAVKIAEKPSKSIVDRMLGAVSNTVKYGNSVFDVVHKRTSNNSTNNSSNQIMEDQS